VRGQGQQPRHFPAAGLVPLIQQHSANQEQIIESALTGDQDLAFQAIYNDPSNSLTLDQTWEMFNEMLEAGKPGNA
jgi:alpha-galactosidase/6-phospho-beta-glucosidase family protein